MGFEFKCPECYYKWISRGDRIPSICPNCHARIYDKLLEETENVEEYKKSEESLGFIQLFNEVKKSGKLIVWIIFVIISLSIIFGIFRFA